MYFSMFFPLSTNKNPGNCIYNKMGRKVERRGQIIKGPGGLRNSMAVIPLTFPRLGAEEAGSQKARGCIFKKGSKKSQRTR